MKNLTQFLNRAIVTTAFLLLTSCAIRDNQQAITVTSQNLGRDFLPQTTIIYSSNVHGELEPCGCRSNPVGGLSRKWNFFKRDGYGSHSQNLIVDSGDLFYQSNTVPPFLKNQWDLQAFTMLESYNLMGCDAFSPGDMDFASGLETFQALKNKAKFPFISANIFYKQTGKPLLDAYVIIEKQGVKIALFGLYDETLDLPAELSATDHIEVAQKLVVELKKKAQVVLALTHLGLEKDEALARAVPGIDAIFGAHSQSFLQDPIRISETMIFQTSFRNQHIGLYKNGTNKLVALEPLFDDATGAEKANPISVLLETTKKKVADINKKNEEDLQSTSSIEDAKHPAYQTFVKCVDCHTPQYDFYKKTDHARAYKTLVNKKQNYNKDCLKCHTLGMNEPSGWHKVTDLVFSSTNKPIPNESFATSLPQMTAKSLTRYNKAYLNVQCEHCHGPGNDHPWSGQYTKAVKMETCLKCHTPEQAPAWYENGKPLESVIKTKIKSVACPR